MGLLFHNKIILTSNLKKEVVLRQVIRKLAENINSICVVGHGHSHLVDLPAHMLGNGGYQITLHNNESSVFIKLNDINKFSPTYTEKMECTLDNCFTNQTTGKTKMLVTKPQRIRIANNLDSICLAENLNYNLKQGSTESKIIPFSGKRTSSFPGVVDNSTDLLTYLYLNEDTGTTSLIFKHYEPTSLPADKIIYLNFGYQGHKHPTKQYSTCVLEQLGPELKWVKWYYNEGLVGGAFEFNPACTYMVIKPNNLSTTLKWVWVNSNGERIELDKKQEINVIYP